MNDKIRRYLSPLEMLELRLGLLHRIQFLGGCNPNRFSSIKNSISRCARLYARLKGVEPHSNPKLIAAREKTLKIMQAKNLNEYLKEMRL